MTGKIFRSIFTVSVSVLLVTILVVAGFMGAYLDKGQLDELRDELDIAASATEKLGIVYLKNLKSDRYRLTWIAENGDIIYDTDVDAVDMENHTDREEVREAMEKGKGSSYRYSSTLTEKTLYEAKRLDDNSVLRISVSHATTIVLIAGMLMPVIIVFMLAALLSFILAKRMARNIVKPFNELDLEHPMENDTYEELSPLLHRIYSQHREIEKNIQELQWKKDEFIQITEQMAEGLVLLDERGKVLSINPSAMSVFQTDRSCIGQDFLKIDRSSELSGAMQKALKTGHEELRIRRAGRKYQINISRTVSEDHIRGSVLLAFDVTEQASAEQSRREFTANVSHELKTPLQSISGSAELIENGLMKPEDLPRFARNIRKESGRLVNLIDDIIRLSQLDEGYNIPTEEVCLGDVVDEVFTVLQEPASVRNVTMECLGDGIVTGVKRLLFEMIYNLCDNAVKYNRQDGHVGVYIKQTENKTEISVEDTGIGIPEEHQSRVFERFYRVDKSHSKQSGGTGLGLSIVKHVVQYHHGKLKLQSKEGKGTKITVILPKIQNNGREVKNNDL